VAEGEGRLRVTGDFSSFLGARPHSRKAWFRVWRYVSDAFYRGRQYTLSVPSGHRIYTPWFALGDDRAFEEAIRAVRTRGQLMVSLDRCYVLYRVAQWALQLPGDMAECGVYTGGTANLLAHVIAKNEGNARLHLFDSFEGMPATAEAERDYHQPGEYSDVSVSNVRHRLSDYDFVDIRPGFIPTTFGDMESLARFSFVHIDLDIFDATLEACRWFWPRVRTGGFVVFDDYGFYPYRHAARAAIDQFFDGQGIKPLPLSTGQALIVKLGIRPADE
jgi:O-methyltransferase